MGDVRYNVFIQGTKSQGNLVCAGLILSILFKIGLLQVPQNYERSILNPFNLCIRIHSFVRSHVFKSVL